MTKTVDDIIKNLAKQKVRVENMVSTSYLFTQESINKAEQELIAKKRKYGLIYNGK